jgi:MYXO-CTERM domain-containing protein
MLTRSTRSAIALGCVTAAAAFAVPLAARTLAVASAGPEVVLAPPSLAAAGGLPYALGSDGTNFAVFNSSFGAQRVSPAGTLLDPTEVPFPYPYATDFNFGTGIAVAPSASGYLCVWNDYGVELAHLDANLAPVETTPTSLATIPVDDFAYVAIAKGASGYLVAWVGEDPEVDPGIIGAQLLDATGAPVGSALTLGPSVANMAGPAIAYGGGNYEIAWGAGSSVLAVRVSEAGVLLDASPRTVATTLDYSVPVIAATATEYVVAWGDSGRDGGAPGIFAAHVGFDGAVVDPGGIGVAPNAYTPTLAYAPGEGLVMGWTSGGQVDVAVVDEPTLAITSQDPLPASGAYGTPAPVVASNGTTVLAAWGEGFNTGAAPLGPSASPTGTPATLGWVTGHNGASQIAWSGSGYFVAWQTGSPGASGAIWGRLLDATGAPLGPPILVTLPPYGNVGDPLVVWTGAEYVVVFPVGSATWYTVRVDSSGNVLDTMVGDIDVYTAISQVLFTGGNGKFFQIVVTGEEVDIYPYDGTPGAFFAPGTKLPIYFSSTQASVAWVDATHFEVAFVGGNSLYASLVDTSAMTFADPITVATDTFYGYMQPLAARGQYETAVAAAPTDGGSMFVYRLDQSGALIDGPYATQSVTGVSSTSLLWDGARYVLAWSAPSSDGGTVAYASDLGSPASPFGLSGAIQPFAENILAAGPSMVRLGDGGALLVATRASDTSVVGVPWTSGDELPPLPVPHDAGTDASSDGGGGAGQADDAGNPVDSGPSPIMTADAGGASEDAGSPVEPVDAGPITTDASADEDGGASSGGATSSSGCSCRVGAEPRATSWPAVAAMLLVGLGLAGRRRRARVTPPRSPFSSRPHASRTRSA